MHDLIELSAVLVDGRMPHDPMVTYIPRAEWDALDEGDRSTHLYEVFGDGNGQGTVFFFVSGDDYGSSEHWPYVKPKAGS